MRLGRQERAGARRAQGVHGIVHRDAVGHADDLGILAADLQNGAHVRVQMSGAHGMGGDLVLDHGSPQHGAHEPARAARRAGTDDVHPRAFHLALQLAHDVLRRLGRLPSVHRYERAMMARFSSMITPFVEMEPMSNAAIALCHLLFILLQWKAWS